MLLIEFYELRNYDLIAFFDYSQNFIFWTKYVAVKLLRFNND